MAKIQDIKEQITAPDNVEVVLDGGNLTIKSEKGSLSRVFSHPKIDLKVNGKVIEISCKSPRRKNKALAGTFVAHINNMIRGVTEGFEYKMKTVFSHFPIKTSVELTSTAFFYFDAKVIAILSGNLLVINPSQ